MNKKTSVKVLKITSIVLAVEAVVVLILLLWLLFGGSFKGDNVDNPSDSNSTGNTVYEESKNENITEESQTVQESSQMQSDSGSGVKEQEEDRDESADQGISNAGEDTESQAGTGGTASQESSVVEEESIIQSNWGEIDWN